MPFGNFDKLWFAKGPRVVAAIDGHLRTIWAVVVDPFDAITRHAHASMARRSAQLVIFANAKGRFIPIAFVGHGVKEDVAVNLHRPLAIAVVEKRPKTVFVRCMPCAARGVITRRAQPRLDRHAVRFLLRIPSVGCNDTALGINFEVVALTFADDASCVFDQMFIGVVEELTTVSISAGVRKHYAAAFEIGRANRLLAIFTQFVCLDCKGVGCLGFELVCYEICPTSTFYSAELLKAAFCIDRIDQIAVGPLDFIPANLHRGLAHENGP